MINKTKFKQLLLLLLVFTFSATITFGQTCGDINVDGSRNIVDALLVAQCYVGLTSCPSAYIGDVNCDGQVNIVDALLIAQLYVGLISILNCCGETPTPTPAAVTLEIQAEDATWDDAVVESDHSGYTGSGYVNTENTSGVWIEWTIDVSNAANAVCVFRYANEGSDRPMDLSVNGNVQTSLSFPDSGGWTSWSTQTGDIILAGGSNAIRLTTTSANGAPNMDKMDITISGGIVVTPEPTPIVTPGPTSETGDLFIDDYVPENNRDLWEEYIAELDYVVETGGNGGTRTITHTILVRQGTTYDGQGETLIAEGMGDGSQDEGQKPLFLLEPGATLKNVTIGFPGCDGIHMLGDNTLDNVNWPDVGEDAASVRSYFPGGDINISNGYANNAADKVFQFNRECVVRVTNFTSSNISKFIRQNGGTTFPLTIYLDTVTVNNFGECIVRSDSPNCYVYYRNLSSNESQSDWWRLETTPQQY